MMNPPLRPLSPFLLLATLAWLTISCSNPSRVPMEDQVRLVLSTTTLSPTTTYELRFDDPVIGPEEVGQIAEVSPLKIRPSIEGKFQWTSTRSGVFLPSQPPLLARTYAFSLNPSWKRQSGTEATLYKEFESPGFQVIWNTWYAYSYDNITSLPSIEIVFNGDLDARRAARRFVFEADDGRRIRADVRQATPEDSLFEGDGHLYYQTWNETFAEFKAQQDGQDFVSEKPDAIENAVVVTPVRRLPPGNWSLTARAGIRSPLHFTRLAESWVLELGRVRLFEVTGAQAQTIAGPTRWIDLGLSKPVDLDEVPHPEDLVRVDPQPVDFKVTHGPYGFRLDGLFDFNLDYTVTLDPGLVSTDEQRIDDPFTETVVFEPLRPRVALPSFTAHQAAAGGRTFRIESVNLNALEVTAKRLDARTIVPALQVYESYVRKDNDPQAEQSPYREIDLRTVPGVTVFQKTILPEAGVDAVATSTLNWDDVLGEDGRGAVFLSALSGYTPSYLLASAGAQTLLQLTDLGMVWKTSNDSLWVYVFSLESGKPIPGVTVEVVDPENQVLRSAGTQWNGMATMPLSEEDTGYLVASLDDDVHAQRFYPGSSNISVWGFGIDFDWYGNEGEAQDEIYLFSDRDVYRPGETIHLKGYARSVNGNDVGAPSTNEARIEVIDPLGRHIMSRDFDLSATGSFDFSIDLPELPLGNYLAWIAVGEGSTVQYFEVTPFTPNAFELKTQAPRESGPDETLNLSLSAQYYMGKALSKARVKWSLQAQDSGFYPDGFEEFQFTTRINSHKLNRRPGGMSLDGSGIVNDEGHFPLQPEIPINATAPQPRHVSLTFEVTDLNQQTLIESVAFTRHSSDFYLGVRRGGDVSAVGEPIPIDVIAVRSDGDPEIAPREAGIQIQRVQWNTVRREGAGGSVDYVAEPTLTTVHQDRLQTQVARQEGIQWTVDGQSPAATFTPEAPGEYLLEVRTRDQNGFDVITAETFHVYGAEEAWWNYRNQVQMELIPDKESYLPGETATLLVKSPLAGTALITVETNRVQRSFITELSGTEPVIRIPLRESDAPNVYVSAFLVRGSADSTLTYPKPEYRIGYAELQVDSPSRRLTVEVDSPEESVLPGDEVEVTVQATRAGGAPAVNAEVTLYAVDEGILSLMGYHSPDPYTFFNRTRSLAVRSSSTFHDLLEEDPAYQDAVNKGFIVGGGGDPTLRTNFLPCAFWQARMKTDSNGKVTARFTAPDSLTRYRVMAVVASGWTAFGAAEASFEIAKPLMIAPAIPGFGHVGDDLVARALVHNLTPHDGSAQVTLQLADGSKHSDDRDSPQKTVTLDLPAGSSRAVDFPVQLMEAGEAEWIWTATLNGHSFKDRVLSTLPIAPSAPLLREIRLSRVTEDSPWQPLEDADPQITQGNGMVTVTASRSRLLQINEAVNQLLNYPYGCAEQTISAILPWIVLNDLAASVPELQRPEDEIRKAVNHGFTRLFSMQRADGGIGYWPGARSSSDWVSAYTGIVASLAINQGYHVPERDMEYLTYYLQSHVKDLSEAKAAHDLETRIMSLLALALRGDPNHAAFDILFERRSDLSPESRAMLAWVGALMEKDPSSVEALLKEPETPNADYASPWFGLAARTDAIRLLAWLHTDPDSNQVERIVVELMQRRSRGHWETTQGNAWTVWAFAEYARRVEGNPGNVAGSFLVQTARQPFSLTREEPTIRTTLELPHDDPEALQVSSTTPNNVYAEARLEARAALAEQPAQDRGFRLIRSYRKIMDDGNLAPARDLKVGDRVLVTLELVADQPARYVAIEDPLPSVLEAVHPRFTGSQIEMPEGKWSSLYTDHREMHGDRVLFFVNSLAPGKYIVHYPARVRAAGDVFAPSAKVEEMYNPDRRGITASSRLEAAPLNR